MRFTARETVAIETPARRATSRMLTAPGRRLGGLFLRLLTGTTIVRFLVVSQSGKPVLLACKPNVSIYLQAEPGKDERPHSPGAMDESSIFGNRFPIFDFAGYR
jgi:hypothetical protein